MKKSTILFLILSIWGNLMPTSGTSIANDNMQKVGLTIVDTCTQALAKAMPPVFCWKEANDSSIIPTDCPNGYFRNLALCYENCRPGYSFNAGLCRSNCHRGYKDLGLSCFKSHIEQHFKKVYIPRSMTNFDAKIACPKDLYRVGSLCYRDCHKIAMENCGPAACSSDILSCSLTILHMILDVIKGALDMTMFILSFGTSTEASKVLKVVKEKIENVAEPVINDFFNILKKVVNNKYKNDIWGTAKLIAKEVFISITKAASDELKSQFFDVQKKSNELCDEVFNNAIQHVKKTQKVTKESLINSVTGVNLRPIVDGCDLTKKVDPLKCIKSIMETAKNYDPTGILTIATTFMHPNCKIISIHKNEEPEIINDIPFGCFRFYTKINYQGQYYEFCQPAINILYTYIPANVASFRVSNTGFYSFYRKEEYQGNFYSIGKGAGLPTFEDIPFPKDGASEEEILRFESQFFLYIGSVRYMKEECIYITITFHGINHMTEICNDLKELKLGTIGDNIVILKTKFANGNGPVYNYEIENAEEMVTNRTLHSYQLFDNYLGYKDLKEGESVPLIKKNIFDKEFSNIVIKGNPKITAWIFAMGFKCEPKIELNEFNQEITKNDMEKRGWMSFTSIEVIYNYDAQGFLCGNEAKIDTGEIIRNIGDNIECFSEDAEHCLIFKNKSNSDCANYINNNINKLKPVTCGAHHKLIDNTPGYTTIGHWCQKGKDYFKIKPSLFE